MTGQTQNLYEGNGKISHSNLCKAECDTTVKRNKDAAVWTWKIPREVNGEGVDSMCIRHSFGVKGWKLEPIFAYACIDLRNLEGRCP